MLLPILSGSLLSADLQRLTHERVAEPCHVPDTLRPNDPALHVAEMQSQGLNTCRYSVILHRDSKYKKIEK
jgi:hypothetical protein